MSRQMNGYSMKFVLFFLLGSILWLAVALLYASSSGQELRTNLKTQADSQYARLQEVWQKGMQVMRDRINRMGSDLQAMTSGSKESVKPA